jgi:hypothetical protein
MSDDNKIRDAADAIRGVAEAVPVYQDALQPAAKEIGIALQSVAKTIHIALAPVSALVWGYERIGDYLQQTLTEKLRNVPLERIISPSPTIAGPTVEALRFTAHEPSLREMYASLLATAMDGETARNAHPSFVEFIRQISSDEAQIISLTAKVKHSHFINAFLTPKDYQSEREPIPITNGFIEAENQITLSCRDTTLSYFDNLERLGLVSVKTMNSSEAPQLKDWFLSWPAVIKAFEEAKASHIYRAVVQWKMIRLTHLGKQFCRACVSEPSPPD